MNVCIAHGGDISEPSGGTDRVLAFVEGFQENGFDVTLVVPRPQHALPPRAEDTTVVGVAVPDSPAPLRAMLVARRAKRIADRTGAHLQLEHSTMAGLATMVGCSEYVLDVHDLSYPSPRFGSTVLGPMRRRFVRAIERRGVRKASHAIAVSSPIKDVLVKEWGVPAADVTVIPNGYSEDEIARYRDVEEVPGRVGFIGTLHPKLDLETFIEVAKLPDVESLVIIGDGAARAELDRLVRREAVDETVCLTGRLPTEDAYPLLASSQVVVYPLHRSRHTKMLVSVKLFTYSALGRAMVLDDVSESDVWARYKARRAALFADPDDRRDFVRKVRTILRDDELRDDVRRNAKELGGEYTWERAAERAVELYLGKAIRTREVNR